MRPKTWAKIFIVAFTALGLFVVFNEGLSLLNEPSDTLVAVGYGIIVGVACVLASAAVWLLKWTLKRVESLDKN